MESEQRKEILTREIIKKEIKDIYSHNFMFRLVFSAFIILWSVFFGYVFSLGDNSPHAIKIWFPIIVATITLIPLTLILVYYLRLVIVLNKNEFTITVDKLVNTKEPLLYRERERYNPMEINYHQPHPFKPTILFYLHFLELSFCLCFSNNKKYYIPMGINYRWSEKYRMDFGSVFRYSEIGDEFYLANIGKRILIAYNTKLFEFKD